MKLLILDNYDSFTYNLFHYLEDLVENVEVFRNDEIEIDAVEAYDAIVLSPGPGLPEDAGICLDVILRYHKTKKILGVCLGHQAIALAFGGALRNLQYVHHGMQRKTIVGQTKDILFEGLPNVFLSGRYHSWVVDKDKMPPDLEITATDENGEIMAMRHKQYNLRGVQFHPESIMTAYGKKILQNWLEG